MSVKCQVLLLYDNFGKKLRSDGRGELDRACDSGQWIVIDSKVLSSERSLLTLLHNQYHAAHVHPV